MQETLLPTAFLKRKANGFPAGMGVLNQQEEWALVYPMEAFAENKAQKPSAPTIEPKLSL